MPTTINSDGVTLIPFVPSSSALFTFTAALTDSSGNAATYILTTPYNIFGKRYYLTCADSQGNHIFTVPLTGSPDVFDIPLSAGYFQTSVLYRASTNNIEISDVALTGSRPGINTVGGSLINRPASPDLSKISYKLLLDGTWELDGKYVLDGKRGALSDDDSTTGGST
jgi:hypothetical protein